MTAVDKIRQEGFKEGFEKGFREGFEKGRNLIVKKLLEKGTMSSEEISRTFELDLLWVTELAKRTREMWCEANGMFHVLEWKNIPGPNRSSNRFFGKKKKAAMTAVDKIRQEGFEEGFKMEVEKTREDFVKKLLEKKMSPEEISRTLELDLLWVKELAGRLREGVTQMP
ncbi:MAG: hypothetical protein ACYDBP_13135 [Leptospirales bacterium]